jgi:excisionase family DNA binding protein
VTGVELQEILTAKEAAAFLRIGRNQLYDLAGRGDIPCRRVGRKEYRFSRAALAPLVRTFLVAEHADPPAGPHTYFIRGRVTGLIKIGRAADVATRLGDLQCGSPDILELVGAFPGVQEETLLHTQFAADRRHGEWFHPSPALLQWIIDRSTWRGIGYWILQRGGT